MLSNKALIQTFSYFDIFSYPLTLDEVFVFLVGEKLNKKNLQNEIRKYSFIEQKDQYYFLSGRQDLVPMRKMREEISNEKKLKAEKMVHLLCKIPTIEAVALSGSVACKNARPEDDIDLFFITRKNSVWISRFLVYFLLKVTDSIRNQKLTSDRFCPNMFVSEDALLIKTQNLYTASEISHIIPLFERRNAFFQFIEQNHWIVNFFPNYKYKNKKRGKDFQKKYRFISGILLPFELAFFSAQYLVMKRKITNEKISFSRIQFHPEDLSSKILGLWENRMNNTNLLDKSTYYDTSKESLFHDHTPGS